MKKVLKQVCLGLRGDIFVCLSESQHFSRCYLDKKSQRTMLAVVDYMRRQKR